ncbi:MAG: sulfite exporter TauE/SafE family protein [Deltaproteobacteria bacterium HGW-Deltaproteobacteria-19]|jgi:hypothetical protein|nr:MAG: sulfite exporter TauE/SafE family protein [Deltaproteobacteria bacterium HGW-Deltaproteobacteria-19]
MPPETVFWILLIAFFAGLVQGFTGFGSVLLSLPLIMLWLDVRTAVPVTSLFGALLTVGLTIPLRRYLDWRKVLPLLLGSLPGIPLGVMLLVHLHALWIQRFVGLVLLLYSLWGFFLASPSNRELRGAWPYGFGFLGGLFGGAISASGPPVIVYVTLQPWNKDVLKATLQGFFLFSGIVVILFQAREGLMTEPVLKLFLYSVIPILTGTWLGHVLYGRLGERSYRNVVFAMLGLLGIFTLFRSL